MLNMDLLLKDFQCAVSDLLQFESNWYSVLL